MFEDFAHPTEQPAACAGCPYSKTHSKGPGVGFCPGRGDIEKADIIYIGEAPGGDEIDWAKCPSCGRQGNFVYCPSCTIKGQPYASPFVGRSGKLRNLMLEKASIHPSKVYSTNILKCRPPYNKYPYGDMQAKAEAHCIHNFLAPELKALAAREGPQPTIIAAGAQPSRVLVNLDGIKERRGYVYVNGDYALNSQVAAEGIDWLPPVVPTIHPAFMFHGKTKSADDEIRNLIPITIGDYMKAMRIAKTQELRRVNVQTNNNMNLKFALEAIADDVREAGRLTLDFEWDKDAKVRVPHVIGVGVNDIVYCTPWKDGDAEVLKEFIEIEMHIGIQLKRTFQVVAHNGMTADFILMEELGIWLGPTENRLSFLRDTMLDAHIVYPDELSKLEFWGSMVTDLCFWKDQKEVGNIFTYCGQDVYAADVLHASVDAEIVDLGLEKLVPIHNRCQLALYRMHELGVKVDKGRLQAAKKEIDDGRDAAIAGTPFETMENWRSNDQIHAFFKKKKGKLPRHRVTKKESVDKFILHKWSAQGDEDASSLLTIRELDKGVSTYVNPYLKLMDDQGFLHADLLMTRQGTGRISAVKPGLFQVPKRSKKLKQLVRSCFVPSQPGWVLWECDWAHIEFDLFMHFAGAERYFEMQKEGVDIHQRHADLAGTDRTTAKIVTYGSIYKGGPYEIAYEAASQGFKVVPETIAKVQKVLFEQWPEIEAAWQKMEALVVENKGLLRLPFGRIRRFNGKASDWINEAIATWPQGTVADMLIRCIPEVHYTMVERFQGRVRLPIHDSLFGDCPADEVEKVREFVTRVMGKPWPELGGRVIGVEFSVGSDWAHMTELK